MAQIDALLQHLVAQRARGAVLQADAPSLLESAAGTTQGQPLSGAQIEAMLGEVMPIEARQSLQAQGAANFAYTSPAGAFNLAASRPGGQWRLEIAPDFAYGAPDNSVAHGVTNNSGMGAASSLPPELSGFNWGGLLGSWIWAIGNNTWIGLLGLVPCLGFFMRFFLGAKGNQMAWQNKRWDSVESFRSAQRTWAIVGVALIGASLFFGVILSAILFPVFARARENAQRSACQSNLKQISLAALQFTQDHQNKLPTGTTMAQWQPQLSPYLKNPQLFVCPSHDTGGDSYQVNPALSGADLDAISNPANTPMFVETTPDLHLGGSNIAFADGHIKWYRGEVAEGAIKSR